MLSDSGAKLLVLDAEFEDEVGGIRDDVPVEIYVVREGDAPGWAAPMADFLDAQAEGDFPRLDVDDPLTLMYTSGTTGRQKGALLTHGNAFGKYELREKYAALGSTPT